jgi:hypothetical protein
MFEVTKSVIRTRKSKKDIQYNGEKKRTNNDLQSHWLCRNHIAFVVITLPLS